ncbi:MAG: alpha/beta fold hydrolase [Thermotogaceae bacterium]|nr:alpha/beta fold hydrolase [Thermotogaceae bacterium]
MILLLAALYIFPILFKNGFILMIMSLMFINTLAAMGLNIVTGWTGLVSIGHAAFMSLGAYVSALSFLKLSLPLFISIPFGAIFAAVFGVLLGFPSLRLKGFYLAIVTMGFVVSVEQLFGWMKITGGHIGLKVSPVMSDIVAYYTTLTITIFVITLLQFSLNSKTGRAFKAIRENEIVAASFGIDVPRYKLLSFSLSAFLGGLAGGLYAHTVGYIAPSDFGLMRSLELLAMIVVGGLGSVGGSVVGAAVYTVIPFFLSRSNISLSILFGGLIIVVMLLFPQGIYYYLKIFYYRWIESPITYVMKKFSKSVGKFVETPFGKVHFVVKDGKNPTIIMVHGNWGSWRWFKPVFLKWNLPWRLVAIDLPGFGHSSKPDLPINLENYAKYLRSFIDVMGYKETILVGHSMGTSVILKMLSENSSGVIGAVLISPSPVDGYKTPEEAFPVLKLYERSFSMVKRYIYPVVPDKKLAREIVFDVLNMDKRGFTGNPRALLEDLSSQIPDLNVRILIIRCDNDPLITSEEFRKTSQLLKAGEQVLKGCGHVPQIVVPDNVIKILKNFIEEVDS